MIIGIAGKAGSGKSTFANMLEQYLLDSPYPVDRVNFADYLKEVAYTLGWDGVKDDKGRRGVQLLGTDVVRDCFNPNLWIEKWEEELVPEFITITDDLRFINEAKAIQEKEGVLIEIIGRQTDLGKNKTHKSEEGVPGHFFNITIPNEGTLEDLDRQAHLLSEYILKGLETDEDYN